MSTLNCFKGDQIYKIFKFLYNKEKGSNLMNNFRHVFICHNSHFTAITF